MAECRYNPTFDTDLNEVVPACTVHTCFAPCPHDGEPASPIPVHIDENPSRKEAIEWALDHVNAARPIVVHNGNWSGGRQHQTGESGECWCDPTLIPPEVA